MADGREAIKSTDRVDGTATPKVRFEGVSKEFASRQGAKTRTVRALDDVSLSIREGEVVTLTGMSGCGKTTLLRVLMGLESATSGTVYVNGTPIDGPGKDRAMVFQHAELFPWRSALANVEFGLELRGIRSAERHEIAGRYLRLVGLDESQHLRPYELSGGMRQRVGMARALAIEPDVLLMDEPFGALDAQTRETLQSELLRIHAGDNRTILFVTHDLDEAVLLADRVVMMAPNPGRIHAIVDVDLPRPRPDAVELRASAEFGRIRAHLWRLLQEANSGADASQGVGDRR
ncbi:MAG: ABC transporter ATP-binding protein [Streptosporangiales bacterium]|nr:ABC transporter ATP-binding protein [Streptosporangiales bacterium]MBO0892171.1 ABC transporter ATP-binding protein [Acidothermales bacterium]